MPSFYHTHLVFLFLLVIRLSHCLTVKSASLQKNDVKCNKLVKEPFFDIDLLMAPKAWRIYYMWNLNIGEKCLNVTFQRATPSMIKRIRGDMHEYLEEQPEWEAATMSATISPVGNELLLFAELGTAGRFISLPNLARSSYLLPIKSPVPLTHYVIKLERGGKFLIMLDCKMGIGFLAINEPYEVYRSEILSLADELDLGDGYLACVFKNTDEFSTA